MQIATAAVYDRYCCASIHGGARTLNESELCVLMVDAGIFAAAGSAKGTSLLGGRTLITHLCSVVNSTMGRELGEELNAQAFTAFVLRISSQIYQKTTGSIEAALLKFITEDLILKAKQLHVEPLRKEVCLCLCVCLFV